MKTDKFAKKDITLLQRFFVWIHEKFSNVKNMKYLQII